MAEAVSAEKPVAAEVPIKMLKSEKKAKVPKAQKERKPKAPKVASSHPPYIEMIKDAVAALRDRTGSSPYAIAKFLKDKHTGLPSSWKKTLALQLKRLTQAGKLVKVKSSYKLGDELKKPVKVPKAPKVIKPKTTKATPKKAAAAKSAGRKKVVASKKAGTVKTVAKPMKVLNSVKPKKSTTKAPTKKAVAKRAAPKPRNAPVKSGKKITTPTRKAPKRAKVTNL